MDYYGGNLSSDDCDFALRSVFDSHDDAAHPPVRHETYLLTIVISLFVAFLIHMMTLLIRRFGTAAKPLPVSAEQVEISAQPDDPDELAALAIAIAAMRKECGNPQNTPR